MTSHTYPEGNFLLPAATGLAQIMKRMKKKKTKQAAFPGFKAPAAAAAAAVCSSCRNKCTFCHRRAPRNEMKAAGTPRAAQMEIPMSATGHVEATGDRYNTLLSIHPDISALDILDLRHVNRHRKVVGAVTPSGPADSLARADSRRTKNKTKRVPTLKRERKLQRKGGRKKKTETRVDRGAKQK